MWDSRKRSKRIPASRSCDDQYFCTLFKVGRRMSLRLIEVQSSIYSQTLNTCKTSIIKTSINKTTMIQNVDYYKTSTATKCRNYKRRMLQYAEYYKTPNTTKRRILQNAEYYKTSNTTKRRIIQNVNCFVNQMFRLVFISKNVQIIAPTPCPTYWNHLRSSGVSEV